MSDFAVPFFRNFKYLDEENIQFNIAYKPKILELSEFIKEYRSHRINLIISEFNYDKDFEIFTILNETFKDDNLVFCLPDYNNEVEQLFSENNLKHYYATIINDWENLQRFLSYNVTDIKIGENLAFNAKKASKMAKKKGVSLRVFCNVCLRKVNNIPSIKGFFIRPEDLDLYSEFFDTFEFGFYKLDGTKLSTLYEIYAKDKKWDGKLKNIIYGYLDDEINTFLMSFGERRLQCDRKCFQAYSERCNYCERIAEINKLIQDNKEFLLSNIITTN